MSLLPGVEQAIGQGGWMPLYFDAMGRDYRLLPPLPHFPMVSLSLFYKNKLFFATCIA